MCYGMDLKAGTRSDCLDDNSIRMMEVWLSLVCFGLGWLSKKKWINQNGTICLPPTKLK